VELSPEGEWKVSCGGGPERRGEDLVRAMEEAIAVEGVASIGGREAWDTWIREQAGRIEAEAAR
jgi:hypothetical protein